MKLSELIEDAQKALGEIGDIPVVTTELRTADRPLRAIYGKTDPAKPGAFFITAYPEKLHPLLTKEDPAQPTLGFDI